MEPTSQHAEKEDGFPAAIPLSADSAMCWLMSISPWRHASQSAISTIFWRRANLCPLTFVDVPETAYSRAILGVYELTRVELLRDVFVWAYERSTQEYLAIKQDLAEPDPIRLAYRDVIKQTIHAVVRHAQDEALTVISHAVAARVPAPDRPAVQSVIVDELRRLHEGVLARYGLRPSEFAAWKVRTQG